MRIGLLSDVHGNANALAAVLDSARGQDVQRLICAGDLVGYYYEPHKCLDLLAEWDVECVRGNHEDMLFRLMQDPTLDKDIRKKYGSALAMSASLLTPGQLDYLSNLPARKVITVQGKTFLLCHGAPWDTDCYIYPDAGEEVFYRCAEGGHDYVVLGHTHYQLSVKCGDTLIVNPGSIGQPRGKRRGAAHWAIIDIQSGEYVPQETEYDSSTVIAQARKYDPEVSYLSTILTKGSI